MTMEVRIGGDAAGPCRGLRVLDFSSLVAGPMCAMILGDLGADVVKVEAPRGDSTRPMGPPFKGELSAVFTQFNRNKRSIDLELGKPEGRPVVDRLAERADVLIESFRPGVAERLGIDYASVAPRNPRIVYLSIRGFGDDGPYAGQPAYDTVIQGLVGHMPVQGAGGRPELVRSLVADKSTGLSAVSAILAALFARERNGGRGQKIDLAMLDAFAAFMLPDAMFRETFLPSDEWQNAPDLNRVHRTWDTADGHVVMLIVENAQFEGLARMLEREDWIADPRFASMTARIGHFAELAAAIEAELRKWPTATIVERARRLGVPLAPANAVRDFFADPQAQANTTVFEAKDPMAGRIRYVRYPARLSDNPASLRRHPPRLGEHTHEILAEEGFSDEEIRRLRATAVIRPAI